MKRFLPVFACIGLVPLSGFAAAGELDFYRDVYPFLKTNCISCHNKTTTKAGLNMETPELMIQGGDSGPSIVPGKSAESLLVEASAHSDFIEMPPSKNKTGARALIDAELAKLKQWIDEGAKSSKQEVSRVVWQALAAEVDPIYAVAMTEDGRYVACGRGNRMFLYDLAERRLVSRIEEGEDKLAHRALINSLAFSPDGNRLASGSYREVKLWKKHQAPSSVREADPALGAVVSAAFPGGKRIVAADGTGALTILDAASGEVVRAMEGADSGSVSLLAVSPDGTKVAAFSSGWHLSVWNVADGKRIAKQTTPDPSLEAKAQTAAATHSAAAKALAEAEAALKKATAAKAQAAAALEKRKPEVGAAPDEAGGKQIASAEATLAAATKTEASAATQRNAARQSADATKKASDAAAADAARARGLEAKALAWSDDGKSILTASGDNRLQVWAVPDSGTAFPAPRVLADSKAAVTCIATGPGGKFATGGDDNKVLVWNLDDGKMIREFDAAVVDVSFSPDGTRIATATADGRVRLWDAATGTQLFDLRGTPGMTAKVAEVERAIDREKLEQAFQKSSAAAIEARDKGLVDLLGKAKDAVVAMNKKLPEAEKAVPPAKEARIAAEEKVAEAEAALKNPPEGKTEPALQAELKKTKVALLGAQTKENDAVAALAAFRSNITDAEAKQQKITDTQAENAKQIAEAKAAAEAAKKRETAAATALAAAKKEVAALGAKPLALAFSADSARVAAGFEDGSVRTWSVASGIPLEETEGSAAKAAILVPKADGSFLFCRADSGTLLIAGAPQWKLELVLGGEIQPDLFGGRVNAVAFSPDGKTLATGSGEPSRSGDITLFDAASGRATATWKDRHADSVISLDFSPDGKRLASGAADKIARVTDVATGGEVHLFEGHTHYVNDVAFRSDGRVLATAGADGVVNSWDLTIGERKKKIEGWTKEVTSLQFIGATDRLVTSAGNNLVRIVTDAGTQVRAISGLPDFMQAAASTADGRTIVGGGEDSNLRVWNGTDGKEIVAFGTP
ncbi:MAG: c-type cytochrome domain-containing protein [Verrucomicrobiales bacterium]